MAYCLFPDQWGNVQIFDEEGTPLTKGIKEISGDDVKIDNNKSGLFLRKITIKKYNQLIKAGIIIVEGQEETQIRVKKILKLVKDNYINPDNENNTKLKLKRINVDKKYKNIIIKGLADNCGLSGQICSTIQGLKDNLMSQQDIEKIYNHKIANLTTIKGYLENEKIVELFKDILVYNKKCKSVKDPCKLSEKEFLYYFLSAVKIHTKNNDIDIDKKIDEICGVKWNSSSKIDYDHVKPLDWTDIDTKNNKTFQTKRLWDSSTKISPIGI